MSRKQPNPPPDHPKPPPPPAPPFPVRRETTGCAESLAKQFHEAYERLAPQFGYETKEETREFQSDSPNGHLMIAVCREILKHNRAIAGKLST